jgi:hypothetical protein
VKTYSYSLNAFAAWFIFSCFAGKLNGILQAGPLDPTSNAKMLLAGLARGVLRGFGSRRRPARPPRKRPCLYCGQNAAGSNIYAKAQLKLKNGSDEALNRRDSNSVASDACRMFVVAQTFGQSASGAGKDRTTFRSQGVPSSGSGPV